MREGACIGAATMLQPWTLRLILRAVECYYCVCHITACVCVYYCRTYYKAVCGGGGGQ